jgi:hypothetical protein
MSQDIEETPNPRQGSGFDRLRGVPAGGGVRRWPAARAAPGPIARGLAAVRLPSPVAANGGEDGAPGTGCGVLPRRT